MRQIRLAASLTAVVMLTGACAGTADPTAARPTVTPSLPQTTTPGTPTKAHPAKKTASTTSTTTRRTLTPTRKPKPKPAGVTLAFTGDVHFEDRNRALLRNPATAFGPISKTLRAADVAVINLETPITTRGSGERDKPYVFRSPPATYDAVKAAGVDAVSLANNHVLDYGHVGLADTLRSAAQAGVPTYGAGENASQAWKPWITTVKGVRIAIVGISATDKSRNWVARSDRFGIAHSVDLQRSLDAVRQASRQADVVIVHMHWGTERVQCATGQQKSLARRLAAAGADAVVGSHSHVLEGDGWLGNTFVDYGLGNFVWYSNLDGSNRTGVLRLTVDGGRVTSSDFVPAKIDHSGRPIPATGGRARRTGEVRADLRECAGLASAPQ